MKERDFRKGVASIVVQLPLLCSLHLHFTACLHVSIFTFIHFSYFQMFSFRHDPNQSINQSINQSRSRLINQPKSINLRGDISFTDGQKFVTQNEGTTSEKDVKEIDFPKEVASPLVQLLFLYSLAFSTLSSRFHKFSFRFHIFSSR